MKHIHIWRLRQRYRELLQLIRSSRRNPAARDQASDLLRRKDELRRAMVIAELGLAPVPVPRRR